jgi:hypothetical protein
LFSSVSIAGETFCICCSLCTCIMLPSLLTLLAILLFRQIFGPESSGKTTLALHAIAEIQASPADQLIPFFACKMF